METPLVIRFVSGNPNESLDKATRTMVRSHAMSEFRRRQREQKQSEAEKYRRQRARNDPTNSLCTCNSALQRLRDLPTPIRHKDKIQRISEHVSDSYKVCPTCGKVQFSELSPTGQYEFLKKQCPSITGFVATDFDPFGSMAIPDFPGVGIGIQDTRELNIIKAHVSFLYRARRQRLLKYYPTWSAKIVAIPLTLFLPAITFCSPGSIKSVVFPEAMRTPALCMSMLYMTYAYLASVRGWSHQSLALAMKAASIREINSQLHNPNTASRTATIASIAYLSIGTWAFGGGADEISIHKAGLEVLVRQRGLESFSNFPFEQTIIKYVVMHHTIISGMMTIPTSEIFKYTFNTATTGFSRTANIQESPFYCPTGAFTHVARSKHCSKETLQVLHSAKDLVDLCLCRGNINSEDFTAKVENISIHLKSFPSATDQGSDVKGDYIFESCRLSALIMLEAISLSIPLILTHKSYTILLMSALEKTDIGNCWGELLGLLYWISLVGSAASQGRKGHRMLDSTLGRSMFQMAFTIDDFDCAICPAQVFGRVQFALRDMAAVVETGVGNLESNKDDF